MAAPDRRAALQPAPERPKDQEWMAARLRRRFRSHPDADRIVAALLLDIGEHVAWSVEKHARPPSVRFGPGAGWKG